MDLSAGNFAKLIDSAFGYALVPPFDPYHDSLSYMISCYVLPYMGLVAYVGTNPLLIGYYSKRVRSYIYPVINFCLPCDISCRQAHITHCFAH